jgi:hypothetical protein
MQLTRTAEQIFTRAVVNYKVRAFRNRCTGERISFNRAVRNASASRHHNKYDDNKQDNDYKHAGYTAACTSAAHATAASVVTIVAVIVAPIVSAVIVSPIITAIISAAHKVSAKLLPYTEADTRAEPGTEAAA